MNVLEMIQRAKFLSDTAQLDESSLGTEVDNKLTITYWGKCLDDAQTEIQNILIEAAQDYFTSSKTITITSGTQEYDVPTDSIQVRAMERVDTANGDYNIYPISINDRRNLATNRNASYPVLAPRLAYFWGMEFGLVDYQAGGSVRVLYIKRLPRLHYATASAGGATSITLPSSVTLGSNPSNEDNYYNGAKIRIISGTGAGQRNTISDYVGSTRVCTVDTWTTNPDNTSVYEIICDIPENHHMILPIWMAMDAYVVDGQEIPNGLKEKYAETKEAMLKSFVPRQSMASRHVARPYSKPWGGIY